MLRPHPTIAGGNAFKAMTLENSSALCPKLNVPTCPMDRDGVK